LKKILGAACAGTLLMACGGMQTMAPVALPAADALTALERACVLDPLNPANWEKLAAALSTEGDRERTAAMYKQAATLRAHDLRKDYDLLAETVPTASQQARAKETADAVPLPRTEVRHINAALVEVLRLPVPPMTSMSPMTPTMPMTSPSATPTSVIRLEISNGNGVTGAAARLARSLDIDGLRTVRLTNVRPFNVPLSRIEYQRTQHGQALALGQRLGLPLHKLRGNPAYADMRIVLGHDVRYLK
jgi:hypothetical protein